MTWNRNTARTRIQQAIKQTKNIEIKSYKRASQLAPGAIGLKQAILVDAAHGYVELLGAPDLMDSDKTETARSHRRYLRFLHLYQRCVHTLFTNLDNRSGIHVRRIDFQNQRLHFIVAEPLDSAERRVALAAVIGHALQQLVESANDLHDELSDAAIRVGIDCGEALAVHNGTKGDREALFLGNPANQAAKLLSRSKPGIYLTNPARTVMDDSWEVVDPKGSKLSQKQLQTCQDTANVTINLDALKKQWRDELQNTPQKEFTFSRPTPPLSNLDLDTLTPKNSRQLEAFVSFADVDGFTVFVATRIARKKGRAQAVQALHVIRKELRDVLRGFGGRKIRYNGDCQVGILMEGTSRTTDEELTATRAVLCAGAMRSSFELIQEELPVTQELGLAIGLDGGPIAVTQLGVKGSRFRCLVGRAVIEAETVQQRCSGEKTALAAGGHGWVNDTLQELMPANTPTKGLTYTRIHAELEAAKADGVTAPNEDLNLTRPRAYAR